MVGDALESNRMTKSSPKTSPTPNDSSGKGKPGWKFLPLVLAMLLALLLLRGGESSSTIPYSFLRQQLDNDNVESIQLSESHASGTFKVPPPQPPSFGLDGQLRNPAAERGTGVPRTSKRFTVQLPPAGQARDELFSKLEQLRLRSEEAKKSGQTGGSEFVYDTVPSDLESPFSYLMFLLLPLGILALGWLLFRKTRENFLGGGFLSGFSRSTAKRYEPSDQIITFKDVAGLEGVKADLQEIVDFLKSPEKFQRLGGRVPKGVLLNGPPGTGKTLLARAVAGEANVAFYSVNGSEFIQMFVGVGASRVRDLFQTAKENGPAIIFIDEIDAVGRQRGAGLGGGHDEREQTLNQILSEMDGFSRNDSVIIMAATNRPDVLDPALLRPGRFDRHITVGRPTLQGRIEIFNVHVRDVPLDHDVNIRRLAEGTVGLTGADIRNIVNEAALWAARNNRDRVFMEDFDYARDKVLMGAKREEVMQPAEKKKTAYHEAGHTLGAWFLKGSQRVHKVTIIPRGRSLGSTHIVPSEDRMSISENEIRDQLVVLMAGRAAETLIYDELTAGAENDLERATSMARRMVSHWGMSDKLGPVSYKLSDEDPFLGREMHQQRQFSEKTQELIDTEVGSILRETEQRAIALLAEKREQLERLTEVLLAKEELSEEEITDLIGPSVHGLPAAVHATPAAVSNPQDQVPSPASSS
jgi:cell division protease FtsH